MALRDSIDPETGGHLTVKRYSSEKAYDDTGSFEHTRITLKPLNPEYRALELREADEGVLKVVGEFVRVIDPRREP